MHGTFSSREGAVLWYVVCPWARCCTRQQPDLLCRQGTWLTLCTAVTLCRLLSCAYLKAYSATRVLAVRVMICAGNQTVSSRQHIGRHRQHRGWVSKFQDLPVPSGTEASFS